MNRLAVFALVVAGSAFAVPAIAQDHWTEGPVWQIDYYRTKPGKFDDYLKYLRSSVAPQTAEAKKQGLILDSKMFVNPSPANEKDWNIAFATLHANFGKALDYNAQDDAKSKAIAEKAYKTRDEDKQREMTAPRFGWRDYIRTSYVREVTLKPLP